MALTVSRPPALVSIAETQERLGGVSLSTVRRLMAAGELTTASIGRRRLVLVHSIDAYVERQVSA